MRRSLFRWFWLPFYRFYALRFVQRSRIWRWKGMTLEVPPGVFHPGIYFSTPIFLKYLEIIDFQGKTVIDVGTGSGALAIFAAKKGGSVYACDINPLAVETARRNAKRAGVETTFVWSDLFSGIPGGAVADFILVNPPYYPRNPANDTERAFFAGEGLVYFQRFFKEAIPFLTSGAVILMILSEDCDWTSIQRFAAAQNFNADIVFEKVRWGERLFVARFRLNAGVAIDR